MGLAEMRLRRRSLQCTAWQFDYANKVVISTVVGSLTFMKASCSSIAGLRTFSKISHPCQWAGQSFGSL